MTPLTALELPFADGVYSFDLKLPQLAELQRLRGAGIFVIYGRLVRGRLALPDGAVALAEHGEAYVEDVFETIRLGLIGGGKGLVNGAEVDVSALRARELVETYCHPAPLRQSWSLAAAIAAARIEGFTPPEDKKKDPQPRARKPRSKKSTSNGSPSPAP